MTRRLKPTSLIPPVIALVLAGGWIGSQRQTIFTLENESAVLQKHLAAVRSAGADPSHAKATGAAKAAKDKEPLDWKKIAAQFAEAKSGGGMGDMRTMIRLQQRLQSMSKEELAAALDEIAALDLPADSREMLEQKLIGPLCQKDPEFALSRCIDRLIDERVAIGWQLANAMKEWLKKDPAKATAWFDLQIAAGKFESKSLDGKSWARIQFEGVMIGTLLSSDPSAAAARLKSLPEDQRADVLRTHMANSIKDEDQLAYANLVREQISEKEQAQMLAQQASLNARGEGYTKITDYLDRIKATPAERAACVEDAVEAKIQHLGRNQKITREDIDSMRAWVTTQSPGTVDKVTASALADSTQSNHELEFSEAAALATQYHEASGNDDVLIGFLTDSSSAYQHKEEARALAEKISDAKRRDEFLSQFN